jgi:Uma2 family endonuclease
MPMVRSKTTLPATWSIADFLEHFDAIPASRIRLLPAPGTATEQDVVRIRAREDRLYELVDGVLVEKAMGFQESCLAVLLARLLGDFVEKHDLGLLAGADGTLQLLPRMVRIPDVSFISWDRLPNREYPRERIPALAPDLAVEVLSRDNTRQEMKRKLKDYFLAGVRLVWYVDPRKRVVQVYTAPDQSSRLDEGQTLDGGEVLPGFRLPVKQLFARVGRRSPRSRTRRRENGT